MQEMHDCSNLPTIRYIATQTTVKDDDDDDTSKQIRDNCGKSCDQIKIKV
jgi:hypothetical protein